MYITQSDYGQVNMNLECKIWQHDTSSY